MSVLSSRHFNTVDIISNLIRSSLLSASGCSAIFCQTHSILGVRMNGSKFIVKTQIQTKPIQPFHGWIFGTIWNCAKRRQYFEKQNEVSIKFWQIFILFRSPKLYKRCAYRGRATEFDKFSFDSNRIVLRWICFIFYAQCVSSPSPFCHSTARMPKWVEFL